MEEFIYDIGEIDNALIHFLPAKEGLQKIVYEAMDEAVRSGGKRVRPMIIYESYQLFQGGKGRMEEIAPMMAAMEMIHTSSLIHDDLPCMDNDTLRRGKPTTWVTYGEDMATLAGDALIVEAFSVIASEMAKIHNPSLILRYAKALDVLAKKTGMQGMIAGQVVDVQKTGEKLNEEELDFIYRLKTGALLEASFMIGAIVGGAKQEEIDVMEEIARNIGMAFQIQDDILDETSTEEELGKPIHSDERNVKTTYVTLYGLNKAKDEVLRCSTEAQRLFDTIQGDTSVLKKMIVWLSMRRK